MRGPPPRNEIPPRCMYSDVKISILSTIRHQIPNLLDPQFFKQQRLFPLMLRSVRMEEEQEDGGLFNISLDSDSDPETSTSTNEPKVPRDFQSEENFQQQLKAWRPKVETGEVFCFLSTPLSFTGLYWGILIVISSYIKPSNYQ